MKRIIKLLVLIMIIFTSTTVYAAENLFNLIKNQAVPDNIQSENTGVNGIDYSSAIRRNDLWNGYGVYKYTKTQYTNGDDIYYFRGDSHVNNVVLFADKCWAIFRTAENNSIKMVYYTNANNGVCPSTVDYWDADQSLRTSYAIKGTDGQDMRGLFTSSYALDSSYINYDYTTFTFNNSGNRTQNLIIGESYKYEDGKYKLQNTVTDSWNSSGKSIYVNNHRYTCGDDSLECEELMFVYAEDYYNYYVAILKNGKSVDDLLNAAVYNSDNKVDSAAKKTVDTWYRNNMLDYQNRIEDVVYCNDRRADIGGMNINNPIYSRSGSVKGALVYEPYIRSTKYHGYKPYNEVEVYADFTCNKNDAFTVSSDKGNGVLKYPVGLMTVDDMILSIGPVDDYNGLNNHLFRSDSALTMTPVELSSYTIYTSCVFWRNGNSGIPSRTNPTHNSYSAYPVIALKSSTYVEGEGTPENPYKVLDLYEVSYDTSELGVTYDKSPYAPGATVTVNNSLIGEQFGDKVLIGWEVDGEQVYDSFEMPSKDVKLKPIFNKVEVKGEEVENPKTGVFNHFIELIILLIVGIYGYKLTISNKKFIKL